MPYMENAANERRNLTAPRNRIFEDVDTQQAFLAGQAALQAADKKSAISEEKAMRAQAVSEQALQAADLATVRYQLAPNFANHEAMQQGRAQQLEAVRNARRAAADAVLARADSERSKGRIPGTARHDSLFYAADLSTAGHPSSEAPNKADTALLGAIAAAAVLQAAQAHDARIPSGADTVFEPSDEPPDARDTLTAPPRAMEQTVGDAPRRAALLAEPQQRIVQTRAPYVTDAQIEADAEYESRINRKAEETAEAKEKYEAAAHSLQELDEKIKAAEAVFVQENHAYRETPSELRYNSLRAAAENYRNLLGQYFRAYQNLPSLQKAYEKNSAQLQKADAYIARVEKQRAYQKTTVRPEAAVKADIAALNAEIEGYENIVYGLKVKRQEAQSGTYDREILENELKIKQIEEIKKKYEEELSWAHYFSYDDLRNRADFAELSQYQKDPRDGTEEYKKSWTGWPNEPWYSALYEAMNGNKDAQDALYSKAAYDPLQTHQTYLLTTYNAAKKGKEETKFATEDQTRLFNYYYRKYGKEAAEKFYEERLRDDLMLQQREESERKWREFATKDTGTAILATIGSVLESPMKGASYLMQLADYLEDGKIDENAAYNNFSRWNTATRDAIMEKMNRSGTWGKVGSFAYGVGTSMADFAWQTLLSGGFSSAGSAAAKRISEAVALGIMGTGAAADATIAAKDRGLTDDRAFALGTIAGAAEILTEKFSVEALLEGVGNRRAWQYILKNAFTEGTEEVGSDVINFFADVLIAKDKSQWEEAIRGYEADGKNEKQAFLLAVRDQALSMGESFLGGFLSGGTMAAVGAGVTVGSTKKWQRSEYQKAGKRLRESGSDTVERMIGGAQTMQEQPQIKLLADQLAAKQREKTLSDEEIGRLFYAIMESGDTVSKRPLQASEQTAPGETKGENAEEKSALSKLYDADLQRAAGAEQQGAPDIAEKSAPSGQDGTQDGATAETYAQMQEKTAVNTDPATHTQAEQAIIEEYQKSVDPDLVEYAEGVKNGKITKGKYSLGAVSERMQNEIKQKLGIDVTGFGNEIYAGGIQHILKRHGESGSANHSMKNMEDIGRLQYVIEQYDMLEDTKATTRGSLDKNRNPAPLIRLSKKVNGTYYVVEAVPDSAAKSLRVITAYMQGRKSEKKKSGKVSQRLNMEAASPEQTSENGFEHNLSAARMIAYGQEKVKKNRSTKSDKTGVQKAADALYEADKTRGEDAASLAALRKEVLDKTYQQLYNEKEIKWAERHGYTLLQESDYVKLSRESGWSPETVRWITTWEQYELLRSAGLHEERICGRLCLVKDHIDVDYVFVTETGVRISNREQMQKGNSPRDAATGKPIELHHLGQDANSPFVELTPEEHRLSGNYSIWHANGKNSWRNKLNAEKGYNRERIKHWNERILRIDMEEKQ